MRFNKLELLTLATQPSQKFDKEGILFLRERQEGFFRRTERTDSKRGKSSGGASLRTLNCYGAAIKVNLERWCRLRGNLLFYFKSRDQWSEPTGVIVLEQFTIRLDDPVNPGEMPFGFTLVFDGGMGQHIGTSSSEERDSWLSAIQSASYSAMRDKLHQLQEKLETKRGHDPDLDVSMWRIRRNTSVDPNELPICEVSLSCDNLLCDGHGRPPNPVIIVHVFLPSDAVWLKYANTEVVQRSSNPSFLSTVCFRSSDGLGLDSRIRFSAFDVRETISQTATPIGSTCVALSSLQDSERIRIPLKGNCGMTVGFLSLSIWSLEREENNPSTESTPIRSISIHDTIYCHRRSQSLPPRFGWKLKLPQQGSFKQLFGNTIVQTYRFHSGLGGDISVREVMAESKLCFQFPQQLLTLWINEEKELLQEVAGMGELVEPWHALQVELLDRHLQLLHLYSQAKENLQAHKGGYFKPSSRKHDRSLEFAPVNLHLQRIWVQNETLKKCGFYDIVTVGAFTAHSHRSKNGGLIKLLQQLKESPMKNRSESSSNRNTRGSSGGTLVVNKISMAHDAIQAIKQIRKEVVDSMRTLMRLAKEKKTTGMIPICDDMIAKTRTLLSLWDPGLVEEALSFVEEHKVSCVIGEEENSGGVGGAPGGGGSGPVVMSPFRRIAQQLQLDQLMAELPIPAQQLVGGSSAATTPTGATILDDLVTPDSPRCLHTFWQVQSQRRNSDEDESQFVIFPDAEEDEKKTRGTENDETSEQSEEEDPKIVSLTNGHSAESEIGKKFLDTHAMCSSPSANYYKPTEEPEPWDLTQLNIEASVMCLVSKVKFLCGRCTSPAVRLRNSQRLVGRSQSFRSEFYNTGSRDQPREAVTLQPGGSLSLAREATLSKVGITGDERINQAVESATAVRNKFTEGLELSSMSDWTNELRPSMRKLRQAMDGLLKTARLTHSVFRLQEDRRAAQRACNVRYRRHVCFSHALTSLVTALMAKLWCQRLDPMFLQIMKAFGPLVCFEGLLSYHGDEIDMWGDMVVAIEDLKTVTFTISSTPAPSTINDPKRCMPRVLGPRSSLTVVLPVPDSVYSVLAASHPHHTSANASSSGSNAICFHITPVFFNMGINEMATLAESLNATRPQEQSNVDNYLRLHEYYHRFRKLGLQPDLSETPQGMVGIKPQVTLSNLMEKLKAEVYTSKSKNVRILQLAGHICRKMKGLRFTSCKSAKDRTGMSVTLEQVNILSAEYDLADHEFQKAMDCMRSEGCRRENTSKNTGVRKYAFNSLQLLTLPKQYRPPAGTYGSAQT